MSSIIMQVVFVINLMLGHHSQQAKQVYSSGIHTTAPQSGLVIIDSDELAKKGH